MHGNIHNGRELLDRRTTTQCTTCIVVVVLLLLHKIFTQGLFWWVFLTHSIVRVSGPAMTQRAPLRRRKGTKNRWPVERGEERPTNLGVPKKERQCVRTRTTSTVADATATVGCCCFVTFCYSPPPGPPPELTPLRELSAYCTHTHTARILSVVRRARLGLRYHQKATDGNAA